ncbi:hypothetical protein [Acinetobacter indicus]|uniref:hypothetical protein n=1 Tax=Acinetobacter indicus TaxID=756892 RepID=UPI003989668E
MTINEFDFAKANQRIGKPVINDHNFYRVNAVTLVMSHGDTEEFNRIFLIAAPSAAHAQVWVEMHFLLEESFNSHQELKEAIQEHTVDENEQDCIASGFLGCVDVGNYKYRCIENVIEITKEYAQQMYSLGDYYESNLGANPFS